ncbi:hypothetical protein [Psychromonas sp. CNPT3]|uniref:hypothetical protein n=1 Tax=Psychromonas sp. CNPT3 TaxID=314282 RepID=UPI0012E9A3A5|nr:hypothetical protein [Psychromonas sp. CNPT3]
MDISNLGKALSSNGYEFVHGNDKFKVKLGGFANKVSISWDQSRQKLSFSYGQYIIPFLALMFGVFTVYSFMNSNMVGTVLQGVVTIMYALMTISTEIKVTELKSVLSKFVPIKDEVVE